MACYFLVQAQMLLARRAGERLLMVCSVVRGLGLCQIIYRFRHGGFGFGLGPAKSGASSSIPACAVAPSMASAVACVAEASAAVAAVAASASCRHCCLARAFHGSLGVPDSAARTIFFLFSPFGSPCSRRMVVAGAVP